MLRIFKTAFIVLCAATVLSPMLVAGPPAANRQIRQQARIREGVRSGDLTGPEAVRLQRNAGRLNRSIRRDRRDQGVFTPRERARARARLGRQSRSIYRRKNDAGVR